MECSQKLNEIQERRICCNLNCCFRKRQFCPILVYVAIFLNISGLASFLNGLAQGVQYIKYLKQEGYISQEDYENYMMSIWQSYLVFWPTTAIQVAKIIYGFKWAIRRHKRKNFAAYYRLTLTLAFSCLVSAIIVMNSFAMTFNEEVF